MTLGLARGTVELAQHDSAWLDAFIAEQRRIQAALRGLGCSVEHIGSTAVSGMPAKPILDIAVGCPANIDPSGLKAAFERLGYEYRGDAGHAGGHVFVRGTGNVRTHHLHVVELGGPQWLAYLALRELLRSSPAARDLYASAKRDLMSRFAGDRKSYTAGKTAIVARLLSHGATNGIGRV